MRRALLWVLTNKPSGASFINWGFSDSDVCEATVVYDGHVVTRRRSRNGKVNEYVLDGESLSGFGVNVPDPVKAVLTLDDTNVELQHSSLFMLNESPPEMARRLNKLTNLEDIDKAFAAVRRMKLENSKSIKAAEEKLEELDDEIDKYSFMEDAGKLVVELEQKEKIVDALNIEYLDTKDLLNTLASLQLKPSPNVDLLSVTDLYTAAQTGKKTLDEVTSLYDTLVSLEVLPELTHITIRQLQDARDRMVAAGMEVEAVNLLVKDINRNELCKMAPLASRDINMNDVNDAIDAYREAQVLISKIEEADTALEAGEMKYKVLYNEYEKIKPATCPLCGNTFGGEHEDCIDS
jgi:soluble cytochrome b562